MEMGSSLFFTFLGYGNARLNSPRILHEILPENYLYLIFQLVTICLRLFPEHRFGVLTLITVGNILSERTLTGCVHWLCYQGLAVWEYSFALAALPMNPSVACKIRVQSFFSNTPPAPTLIIGVSKDLFEASRMFPKISLPQNHLESILSASKQKTL